MLELADAETDAEDENEVSGVGVAETDADRVTFDVADPEPVVDVRAVNVNIAENDALDDPDALAEAESVFEGELVPDDDPVSEEYPLSLPDPEDEAEDVALSDSDGECVAD